MFVAELLHACSGMRWELRAETEGLPDLAQGSAQQALLRQLVPLAAAVPAAKERCAALARVWAAAVAADLGARRAVRLRQRPTPQAELKHLLSDAVVLEIISGSSGGAHTATF
jgi:hypothetical protein